MNANDPLTMPWTIGLAWWRGGLAMAVAAGKVGEAMIAAGEVIEGRSGVIAAALRDPLNADHREFGRMVPEKIDAFARAGTAMIGDMVALQRDLALAWQQALAPLLAGRLPSRAEAETTLARSSAMIERAAGAGARSFVPVHRTVTANARRLKRRHD